MVGVVADLYSVVRSIVRGLMPETDYLALHPCIVIKQDADGTLQLKPDSSRVPALAGVALRTFAPEVDVRVEKGARVLLGFAGGQADAPYACLWGTGSLTTVTVGSGSSDFVALAGKVLAELQSLQSWASTLTAWLVAHGHSGVTTGPGVSGPAAGTPSAPSAPSSVACTKLKAE
jgi:hypothetical protein